MSFTTTFAPSLEYMSAYERPRPAPAPVMRTVLPSKVTESGCGFDEIFLARSRKSCGRESVS